MADIELMDNGVLLVTLQGELDNHQANRIRTELSSAIFGGHVRGIVWNLERLSFMDSAGIGLILGRMRELAPINGETIILNPTSTMDKLFNFAGLGPYIRNYSIEEAIGEIGGVLHG